MRAAINAQVSTQDKGDTENHLHPLREYCARLNWEIAAEYIDHVSGKTADRESLKRLFTDASRRKCDVVLVWALDRFTREGVYETFDHIRKLTLNGVEFEVLALSRTIRRPSGVLHRPSKSGATQPGPSTPNILAFSMPHAASSALTAEGQ